MHESEHALAWLRDGSRMLHVGHVYAIAKVGGRLFRVDFDPRIGLIKGEQRPVSRARALAHFYNNRGAELMGEGNDASGALAGRYLERALELDPGMAAALNNRGVWQVRVGQEARAEADLREALRRRPGHFAALSNLVALLRRQGRPEAADLEARLAVLQARSPLHQLALGLAREEQGDLAGAKGHYERAQRLDPLEPTILMAMARVLEAEGNLRGARRLRERAAALSEPIRPGTVVVR